MFDCLISKKLSWDFKNFNEQHGFCRGRSTTTNLLLYQNYIINALENKLQVDSVYTDFLKAFDRVNHSLLLAKLESLGVEGNILEWIKSYLSDRVQYGSSVSDPNEVPSGVPRGSHMGPLLFNIFVNDLPNVITNCSFLLFADDLKMFRTVQSLSDAERLQFDLNNLSRWCNINLLKLNLGKCQKISFSRNKEAINYAYQINDTNLSETNKIKDLGVIFDTKMNFKSHITEISSRAKKMLGFSLRSARELSVNALKIIYCAQVRSILEYTSIIWSPCYRVDIELLESTQNKFLRYCGYNLGMNRDEYNYSQIQKTLNLNTLTHRRLEIDLIFHKIINGSIDCPEIVELTSLSVNARRSRNSDIFKIPFCRTNYGQNESINRILKSANTHNNKLELFGSSLPSFRKAVKKL